jgi:hypothetical protein
MGGSGPPGRRVEEVGGSVVHRHTAKDGPVSAKAFEGVSQGEEARRSAIRLPLELPLRELDREVREADGAFPGLKMPDKAARGGVSGLAAAAHPDPVFLGVKRNCGIQPAGPDRCGVITGDDEIEPAKVERPGNVTPEGRGAAEDKGFQSQWSLTSG